MRINIQELINKLQLPTFNLGLYTFLSQDPTALQPQFREQAAAYLPQFCLIWKAVELATGHRWKCTSYIRESPSHKRGQAFDLAPEFTPEGEKTYAVSKGSDPILYKRTVLIRQLQTLRNIDFSGDGSNSVGIFIEPDHLHIQIMAKAAGERFPTSIVKWKIEKPVYPDTKQRSNLPEYL